MPAARTRTVVITGVTSGIGAASARELLRLGDQVVPVGRDRTRMEAALANAGGRQEQPVVADLSDLGSVRQAGALLRDRYPRIDVLVNNAGAIFARRHETPEGHERTLALNVLAPFLLTRLLAPSMRGGEDARVVNVASAAHRGARLDLADLESRRRYGGYRAYARSKLALIQLTRAFARRAEPRELSYFSLHPGFVRTRFGLENPGPFGVGLRVAMRLGGISAERAARTVVFAARSPALAGRSGDYLRREGIGVPSARARDDAAGERLWAALESMVGPTP